MWRCQDFWLSTTRPTGHTPENWSAGVRDREPCSLPCGLRSSTGGSQERRKPSKEMGSYRNSARSLHHYFAPQNNTTLTQAPTVNSGGYLEEHGRTLAVFPPLLFLQPDAVTPLCLTPSPFHMPIPDSHFSRMHLFFLPQEEDAVMATWTLQMHVVGKPQHTKATGLICIFNQETPPLSHKGNWCT